MTRTASQAVRHQQRRPAARRLESLSIDFQFRQGVEGRRRLVQLDQSCIPEVQPRNRQRLPLAPRGRGTSRSPTTPEGAVCGSVLGYLYPLAPRGYTETNAPGRPAPRGRPRHRQPKPGRQPRPYRGRVDVAADAARLLWHRGSAATGGSEGNGRGDWTRTSDPLHPMQVRYQTALHPDLWLG